MFIYKRCDCKKHKIKIPFIKTDLLRLVSVPSRLNILLLLDKSPHCVCDVMVHVKLSQTLVSHHLKDLTKAGLVKSEKNGQFVDYSLTNKGKQTVRILKQLI